MKSKLKLGLIVLSALLFSASFGHIVRRILKDREAESAFQSLAEYLSEATDESSEESRIMDETTTATVPSVPESSPLESGPLPVKKQNAFWRKRLILEEAGRISTKPEETDSPSAEVIEETIPAETTTAVQATPPQTTTSKPAATSAATESGRFYNGIRNCVGWLRIEGTAINYPVMQSKDDPEFYLHHAVSGEYNYPGVPFLDARCEPGVSNNLIIYGHNMKNGTMFHDLRYYASKDFWQGHWRISLATVSGAAEYEVMAVIQYNTNRDPFRIYAYTAMDEATFGWFLAQVHSRQIYETGVQAVFGDELLTLSTCDWTYENGRLLVIARRIR